MNIETKKLTIKTFKKCDCGYRIRTEDRKTLVVPRICLKRRKIKKGDELVVDIAHKALIVKMELNGYPLYTEAQVKKALVNK